MLAFNRVNRVPSAGVLGFVNLAVAAIIAAAMTWALALLLGYGVSALIPISRSVSVGVVGGLLVVIELPRLWARLDADYAWLLAEERGFSDFTKFRG